MVMTDNAPKIIPFGKYKGRLVDEVLVDDPNYLQWLAGQDWFRAKFNILHQVIINRGAEPEETLDHNALQVRFLDDDFCMRLLAHIDPQYCEKAITALRAGHQHNLQLIGRWRAVRRRVHRPGRDARAIHADDGDRGYPRRIRARRRERPRLNAAQRIARA